METCTKCKRAEEILEKVAEARASALRENNEMWEKRVEAHGASQYQAGFEAGDRTGRADERAKFKNEQICLERAWEKRLYQVKKEAYAKGKNVGIMEERVRLNENYDNVVIPFIKQEQYKKGQANGIELVRRAFENTYYMECGNKLRLIDTDCDVEIALKKASESLGAKGDIDTAVSAYNVVVGDTPKAEELPANPKPEKLPKKTGKFEAKGDRRARERKED